MTSSYGNQFAAFGQGITGFDEYVKTNNLFPKGDPSDNSPFYRAGNVSVLEPISVFASSNIEDTNRYKSLQYDNYHQLNCNESSRASMVPSKSMPHFPNFGFNDSRLEVSAESFDWSMVSFSTAPAIDVKLQETNVKYQFEHTLVAPTASTIKNNQESLTYLNQGQCYEIKLKCMKGYEQHQFFKSIIRVVFHERRLQYSEKELMELWKNNRPGERIIDIDIPECCGLINVEVDPDSLNSIGFIWNPSKPTGIFVKIQCISTEFTANKHGGEKGVPLRIKVETYSVSSKGEVRDEKLIHCSSCQIKVFKPKGADRKHKRDSEKLLKLNPNDRNQYRIQESCTLLKEMPVEQEGVQPQFGSINNINTQKVPQVALPPKTRHMSQDMTLTIANSAEGFLSGLDCKDTSRNRMSNAGKIGGSGTDLNVSFYGRDGNCESDGMDNDDAFLVDSNNNSSPNNSAKQEIMSEEAARLLLSCIPVVNEVTEDSMRLASGDKVKDMTSEQLAQWLMVEKFMEQSKHFEAFTGNELLGLGQDDLISICGPAEGIRLYNLLHFGFGKPKLSIYVSFQGVSNLYTTYKNVPDQSPQGIPQACLKNHLSSMSQSSLSPSLSATSEGEKMEEEEDIDGLPLPPHSFHHSHKLPMLRSVSLSSVRVLPYHNPRNSNHLIGSFHEQRRRHYVNSKPRLLSEDRTSTGSGTSNTRSQLTFDELNRNVFYPIDLEILSVKNLRDKLSVLFNVPVQQEQLIYFEQFGIQIIASDDHLQTIPNHSKFTSQIIKCRESPNVCDILLKILPNKASYFQP